MTSRRRRRRVLPQTLHGPEPASPESVRRIRRQDFSNVQTLQGVTMTQDQLVEVVKAKAPSVPVTFHEAKDFADAMQYAVDVTEKKRHCEMLLPVEGEQYGPASENGFPTLLERFIAAPGLSEEEYAVLEEKATATPSDASMATSSREMWR